MASMNSTASLLALTATGLFLVMPAAAQARQGSKPYYSESFETKTLVRGYEGFLFPDYYCSYKRYPNRKCNVDARGRERCRVVGWRLEQTCQ